MKNLQLFICSMALVAGAGTVQAGQTCLVSEYYGGNIWRMEDVNGDGDALDAGEKVLWGNGFTRLGEMETAGWAVLAVEEGLTSGANQIVRLEDLNRDGDALDTGERTVWADGLGSPRSVTQGAGGNWYVTELSNDQVWRLVDTNGDGDALDTGERTLYADGLVSPYSAMVHEGDLLVTEYSASDGQVHRLADVNGDGDALDVGENLPITPIVPYPLGLLANGSGGFFFSAFDADAVYQARDLNGDGDMLDTAEVLRYADSVFGGVDGPWGMTPNAGDGFLLADFMDDQVLLVRDVTGDGDALDPGEVTVWADGVTAPGDVAPAPIPEPSTFVLAALGLLGRLAWGRRRRR